MTKLERELIKEVYQFLRNNDDHKRAKILADRMWELNFIS